MAYTLAQHSGFVGTHHEEFRNAVEERFITPVQVDRIRKAGGIIFEDYKDASDAAELANTPPEGGNWLIPQAAGTFVEAVKVEGCPIFIPDSTLRPKLDKIHL